MVIKFDYFLTIDTLPSLYLAASSSNTPLTIKISNKKYLKIISSETLQLHSTDYTNFHYSATAIPVPNLFNYMPFIENYRSKNSIFPLIFKRLGCTVVPMK